MQLCIHGTNGRHHGNGGGGGEEEADSKSPPRASLHSRGNSWFDADIGEGEGERVVGQCRRIKRDRIEERTIPFLGLNRILKFVKCP